MTASARSTNHRRKRPTTKKTSVRPPAKLAKGPARKVTKLAMADPLLAPSTPGAAPVIPEPKSEFHLDFVPGFMYEEIRPVTPELARAYLANMGPQRTPRQFKIFTFAQDMKAGNWLYNGAPLVFDVHGRLRDGQNRLAALVAADVPSLEFRHLFNASEQMIATIDTGSARTFGDVNRMQGIPNWNQTASAVNLWWHYLHDTVELHSPVSHAQLAKLRDEHLNALDQANTLLNTRFKTVKRLARASAAVFLLAYLLEKNETLALDFFEKLDTGLGLEQNDAVFTLRRVLINNMGRQHKVRPMFILAFLIKGFNGYLAKRKIQYIGWRKDEKFPQIGV